MPTKTKNNKVKRAINKRISRLEERISELKNTETIKHQIEFILGATKTGLDVIDPEYHIRYIDPAWKKIYGHLNGKKCYEYFMGKKEPCPDCGIKKALETKTITVTEEILVKENNRPVQITTIPFKNKDGEWLVAEVNADISQRKKAEESWKQLVEVIEVTPDFVGFADANDKHVIYINKSGRKMCGIGEDEDVTKLRIYDVHPEWTNKMLAEEVLPVAARDGIWTGECAFLNIKDKHEIPVSMVLSAHKAPNGEVTVFSTISRDITKRKQNEAELKKYRDQLKKIVKERTAKLEREIRERRQAEKEREAINKELLRSNKRLRQLSLRDSHTGLYNHRYLNEIIEAEFQRAKRYAYPLSVMMLDLDYFKSINDVYGHQFGDLVLKQLADQLKKEVRKYDTVIRYGGEEFIIISPSLDRSSALVFARRILDQINISDFGNIKHIIKLKLSIAVASFPEDEINTGMDLVEVTDQILNKVKESGGNKVYSSVDIKNGKSIISLAESNDVLFLKNKISKLTKRANQGLIEAIFAFAKTIEVKDHYTGEHVERTVHHSTEIAKALELPEYEIEHIKQASALHDLGKIGISESILFKKTKLTKAEFEIIKKHPQIGVDIIRPIHFLHPIIPLILHHHERWDGTGYPYGLKEDAIPLGARIVTVSDVYQALTSNRPYRKAYSRKEAVEIIKQEAGILFDPSIVNIFLKILQKEQ